MPCSQIQFQSQKGDFNNTREHVPIFQIIFFFKHLINILIL